MAINIFRDTTSMIAAIDRVKAPAKFLTDTLFPNVLPCAVTPTVNVEIRRGRRILAPFVTDEGNSVNMEREIAYMRTVTPALMAPSRVVTCLLMTAEKLCRDILRVDDVAVFT